VFNLLKEPPEMSLLKETQRTKLHTKIGLKEKRTTQDVERTTCLWLIVKGGKNQHKLS
jgi:hypothetical protein